MQATRTDSGPMQPLQAPLGLVDAICIIVGIIIGVGIFETPAKVFAGAPGQWEALGVWVLGGLLALAGALCFAELTSTYRRSGGEYVYLTRAFGPTVGFLFGWAQLSVIRPGSIAAVAYIFADYTSILLGFGQAPAVWLAMAVILLLTAINVLGVILGARTQNVLTLAKLVGLAVIVLVGFFWAQPASSAAPPTTVVADSGGWFVAAMIMVLWTYSGWQEAGYVASEVRQGRRNLPLAILAGTLIVTLIYLLVNAACLVGIGFENLHDKKDVNFLNLFTNPTVRTAMCLLVVISALGAINGMVFTTARIYAEFGADHPPFTKLARWSRRWGTPVHALIVQGVISALMVVTVNWIWAERQGRDSFDVLVNGTAAVTWIFFLLTGIALFLLRRKDPEIERPFRVPFYPVLPIIFCLACAFMTWGAIDYAPDESLLGLGILTTGLIFFIFPKNRGMPRFREAPLLTGAGRF